LVVWDFKEVLVVLHLDVVISIRLTGLDKRSRLANDLCNFIDDQPWRLVEDESCLSVFESLPEDVSLHYNYTVFGEALFIKCQFVEDIFLNKSSGTTYAIGYFYLG